MSTIERGTVIRQYSNFGSSKNLFYLREYSFIIRQHHNEHFDVIDDLEGSPYLESTIKIILVIICRSRQRLQRQAWTKWTACCKVFHDYSYEVQVILSRYIPDRVLRTELEVELICNWARQNRDMEPTGLAHVLMTSKRKSAIVNAIQHCRLERLIKDDILYYQGDAPTDDLGHCTVLSGSFDIFQFSSDSHALFELSRMAHRLSSTNHSLVAESQIVKLDVRGLLREAKRLHPLRRLAGCGEIEALTGGKRATCVVASTASEVLILPRRQFLECLGLKHVDDDFLRHTLTDSLEAIDYLHNTGLVRGLAPKDIVGIVECMKKRVINSGQILYIKGDEVTTVFTVVSGDILLDTADIERSPDYVPFSHSEVEKCFILSSGSILGDEGLMGWNRSYAATAVVVSQKAVLYEFVGEGLAFLGKRL